MFKKLNEIKIPAFLKNRYVLAVIVFIVWLTFFDKNDFITQYNYRHELSQLKRDKQFYLTEIEKNKKDLYELMSDSVLLEKFAREKYYMKKDNEDIFVIVTPKKDTEEKFEE